MKKFVFAAIFDVITISIGALIGSYFGSFVGGAIISTAALIISDIFEAILLKVSNLKICDSTPINFIDRNQIPSEYAEEDEDED